MEDNLYASAGSHGEGIGGPVGMDAPKMAATKVEFDEPDIHGMDVGWLSSAFSGFGVDICGQRLTPDMAKKLIFGLLGFISALPRPAARRRQRR